MLKTNNYQKKSVVVIADDLTGAGEIGSILVENKRKPFVLNEELSKDDIGTLTAEYNGLILNLNSRILDSKSAYNKVKCLLNQFKEIRDRLIYKKIDSTLRGNLVEEIEAVLDLNCVDIVLLAPALPKSERITIGGYHLVDQLPIVRSRYAKDMAGNLKSSYLPALFSNKSKYRVGKISLEVVEKGPKSIMDSIMTQHKNAARILISDACTDEDLYNVKEAILNVNLSVLPVGSAGLFRQFFPKRELSNTSPCLVVCGSLNKVARRQIRRLMDEGRAEYIEIDLSQMFTEDREKELEKDVKTAQASLGKGYDTILTTPEREYRIFSETDNARLDFKMKINEFLATVASEIIKTCKLSGLILTGGSTALAIMQNLKAKGTEIKRDLDFLIPVGVLRGGPFDGLSVITKAGGFGEEDVLIKAVKYLRRESISER